MNARPQIVCVVRGAELLLTVDELLSLAVFFRSLPFELIEGVSSGVFRSRRAMDARYDGSVWACRTRNGEGGEDRTAAGVATATQESDRAADG